MALRWPLSWGSQSLDHAGEFSLDSRATSLVGYIWYTLQQQTICCYDASYWTNRFFSTQLSIVDCRNFDSDAAATGLLANQRRAGTQICPRGCCVPASALKARRPVTISSIVFHTNGSILRIHLAGSTLVFSSSVPQSRTLTATPRVTSNVYAVCKQGRTQTEQGVMMTSISGVSSLVAVTSDKRVLLL